MATCEHCEKDMNRAKGCVGVPFRFMDQRQMMPIPYDGSLGIRCGDCGAREGGYHHPGCDLEQCPCGCGSQAIGCPFLVHHDPEKGWVYHDPVKDQTVKWTGPVQHDPSWVNYVPPEFRDPK